MAVQRDKPHVVPDAQGDIALDSVLWVVPALCALFARSIPGASLVRQARLEADDRTAQLNQLLAAADFVISAREISAKALPQQAFPVAVSLRGDGRDDSQHAGLVLAATETTVLLAEREHPPRQVSLEDFARRFTGQALSIADSAPAVADPDAIAATARDRRFGFRWFVPELLRHRGIWREVLIASLVIQLLALALPLFTQAIIDKVVVHRTQSTLITLAVAMGVFMLFSAALSWVRRFSRRLLKFVLNSRHEEEIAI